MPCLPDHFLNAEAQRRRDAEMQRGKQDHLCSSVVEVIIRTWYDLVHAVLVVETLPATSLPPYQFVVFVVPAYA
jgi:hypothetical protein